MNLIETISTVVPLVQAMHDSGFYQFMPVYMRTFGPNIDDAPSVRDVINKFKER